ncbi:MULTISPECIES: hypothetical protein [unclassified Streptomyces]|uniref:hypothetical protein n=1 Tax=unclassified Streptomyces TaxID=2593676 RepID=UPI0033F1E3C9
MEQRIGSSSQPLKAEPVKGAGFDPAHIPGLTAPVTAEPEDAPPPQAGQPPAAETVADDAGTAGEAERPEEKHPEEKSPEEKRPKEKRPEEKREEVVDGPVFEAADRRARIVADHNGVRLHLDDQECEFRWDEIGAVETETSRFGKLFTITVHTPERRWYPIEIEAPARASFTEWETRLDAVLDTYFDDGAADEDAAAADAAEDDADKGAVPEKDTAVGKATADEPPADDA